MPLRLEKVLNQALKKQVSRDKHTILSGKVQGNTINMKFICYT
jgi:hypothetical protein